MLNQVRGFLVEQARIDEVSSDKDLGETSAKLDLMLGFSQVPLVDTQVSVTTDRDSQYIQMPPESLEE